MFAAIAVLATYRTITFGAETRIRFVTAFTAPRNVEYSFSKISQLEEVFFSILLWEAERTPCYPAWHIIENNEYYFSFLMRILTKEKLHIVGEAGIRWHIHSILEDSQIKIRTKIEFEVFFGKTRSQLPRKCYFEHILTRLKCRIIFILKFVSSF